MRNGTRKAALDRYTAPDQNFVLVVTHSLRRIAVPGARSAPKETGNQPRALPGYQGQSPWLVAGLLGAMLLGVMAVPASPHHSFAMYDQTTTRIMTGKLTRYIPGANHAQMMFQVIDNDGTPVLKEGKPVTWGVETGSALAMSRRGVTPDTFPEGTIFTVRLYPLRDGRNFGALAGMLIKCGTTIPKGGCTKETGESLIGEDFDAR